MVKTNFDAKFACLNFDPLINPARTTTTLTLDGWLYMLQRVNDNDNGKRFNGCQ